MSFIEPERLTITCHKGEVLWIAHCLECDIIDTAPTYEAAMTGIQRLLRVHLEYGRQNDSNALHDAPTGYWPTPQTKEVEK